MDEKAVRLKEARTALKLSREKFCEPLGVSSGVIANIELGRAEIKEKFLKHVCEVHNISWEWMDTGEGEMFNPVSESEDIARFMGQVMKDTPDAFRRRLIEVLAAMTPDEWALMERKAREILGETKED